MGPQSRMSSMLLLYFHRRDTHNNHNQQKSSRDALLCVDCAGHSSTVIIWRHLPPETGQSCQTSHRQHRTPRSVVRCSWCLHLWVFTKEQCHPEVQGWAVIVRCHLLLGNKIIKSLRLCHYLQTRWEIITLKLDHAGSGEHLTFLSSSPYQVRLQFGCISRIHSQLGFDTQSLMGQPGPLQSEIFKALSPQVFFLHHYVACIHSLLVPTEKLAGKSGKIQSVQTEAC